MAAPGLLLGMLAGVLASPIIHANAMFPALLCFSLFGLGVGAVTGMVTKRPS